MSKFYEFKQQAESAISECVRSIDEIRQSNGGSEIPTSTFVDLAKRHIGPISGSDNMLDITIPEGKADWRKSAIELVLRRMVLSVVETIPESAPDRFPKLFSTLDLVLAATEADYLEAVVPLTMVEELLDIHTISGCEKLFDYIERRKPRLIVNMVPGRGKGLVMLRMCNEMLRRLSKEKDTVFCGRILMFLANSFPLHERSGVNLRGDFNTEPVLYDKDEDVDADSTLTDDQKTFYKLFWSTRKYFSNPPTIFHDNNFEELQKGANAILDKFKQISNSEQAVSGEGNATESNKRRRSEDVNMVDRDQAEEMLKEINQQFQFPRLLSSRKLLELEIEDTRFRRNVIVQFLILFQYLTGFKSSEKERTQKLLSARGATKQSLVQPVFTLEGDQLQWVKDTKHAMLELLEMTKPHGQLYTDIVLTLLRHERNWIIWKASGCPDFEKPPVDTKVLQDMWQRKRPQTKMALAAYRYPYGNSELTSMFNTSREKLSDLMQSRPAPPKPVEIIDSTLARLEKETNLSDNERFSIANGALFQATRFMLKDKAHLVTKVYTVKKDVYKALKEATNKEGKVDDEATKKTLDVDEKTGKHVDAEIKVLKLTRDLLTGTAANKSGQ
ncbi:hypothetical protein O0I10_000958 [Lichtheimia ornata]|uniref:Uncharacterized protein n=1 Tax=Lichtheimia ornata TaxID=688661 RepID=A0AAD7Y4P9_9FUNG|nr:uncharacterized protein O0I10_000958 [Lichtheimia ornata]KAJ8663709.1 hypothetical protein O0I10_000958 [Lichtheimia ornata]